MESKLLLQLSSSFNTFNLLVEIIRVRVMLKSVNLLVIFNMYLEHTTCSIFGQFSGIFLVTFDTKIYCPHSQKIANF